MLIIKPYGQTTVKAGTASTRRIIQREKKSSSTIPDFVQTHKKLLIAQWIAEIDKTLKKPKTKEDDAQQTLVNARRRLGDACWQRLPKAIQDDASLKKIWKSKIEAKDSKRTNIQKSTQRSNNNRNNHKQDQTKQLQDYKGRWFNTFVGQDIQLEKFTETIAATTAQRIDEHLNQQVNQYSASKGKNGRLAQRANSIEKNTLSLDKYTPSLSAIDSEIKERYTKTTDIAHKIYQYFIKHNPPKYTKVIAMLYDHCGELLPNCDPEQRRGIIQLDRLVKNYYTRLLHPKNQRNAKIDKQRVEERLPKDWPSLQKAIENLENNQEINQLIRLGRIIHYHTQGKPLENWDSTTNIATSDYLSSDGQTEIKQTEAFVRIWRHSLAYAARGLTNWLMPDFDYDILSEKGKNKLQSIEVDQNSFYPIFAKNAPEQQRDLAEHLRFSLATMRHASFHFKDINQFIQSLKGSNTTTPDFFQQIIKDDTDQRAARLVESLESAKCHHYYTNEKIKEIVRATATERTSVITLPRFAKLLKRLTNTESQLFTGLPKTAEQRKDNKPCQAWHQLAQIVYDKPFRAWLEEQSPEQVTQWVKTACKTATEAAKGINKRNTDEGLLLSKAEKLSLQEGQNYLHLSYQLASHTASEMRVQNDYQPDSNKAREQASYIQNLIMDIVILALQQYLKENFNWLNNQPTQLDQPQDIPKIDSTSTNTEQQQWKDWQITLYALLHLIPVASVGSLLHQLRRWQIAHTASANQTTPPQQLSQKLLPILQLYLDCHDAKFSGGSQNLPQAMGDKLRDFFQDGVYQQITKNEQTKDLIWRRGIREMLRFGMAGKLDTLWKKHQITKTDWEKYTSYQLKHENDTAQKHNKSIAALHKKRMDIHKQWVDNKKMFSKNQRESYKDTLEEIYTYDCLAAKVELRNHLKSYQITMAVLSRLLDYAGLWERDLYFVFLARLYQNKQKPNELSNKAQNKLANGQIVEALRESDSNVAIKSIINRLNDIFYFYTSNEKKSDKKDTHQKIRNNFAHFKMLQKGQSANELDITAEINKARKLMSYDRKLKNAVSKSIKELFAREKIIVKWKTEDHNLVFNNIQSQDIRHLNGQAKVPAHPDQCIAMLRMLIEACAQHEISKNTQKRR